MIKINSSQLIAGNKPDRNTIREDSGQVLVETMVALSMFVIGLLGLLSLLTYSIGMNKVISDQYVAAYLAAEGIEVVKNIEDTNVANGDPYNLGLDPGSYQVDYNSTASTIKPFDSTAYLKFDGNNTTGAKRYTYSPQGFSPMQTPFQRRVDISLASGGDELIVKSTVSWVSRGGSSQSIAVEDHFFRWRF
jgi:type II secretory pathway pseudopilin PulG